MNIVLVEDNVDLRKSLADFLSMCGHTVSEAGNAIELYRLMDDTPCDVAVVDINLPHHDGFSVTRYLRDSSLCSVIITSVRDAVSDRVQGYKSGADIYMVKPVEPEELAAAIEHLGQKHRGEDEVQPAVPTWRYDVAARCLWAPNNTAVTLSAREAVLVEALGRSHTRMVSRDDFLVALGDANAPNANGRIDTMISRLRTKVRQTTGMALPVVTAHNVGFSFTMPLRLG